VVDIMIDLRQGDCLEIMKEIPDKSVDMILCDLPYKITACKWDKEIDLKKLVIEYNRIIKENGNIVLFSKQPFTTELINANRKYFRYEIIWQKQQATNPMCAKKRIMPIHENILVFYKKLGTYNPQMSYGNKNYSAFNSDKQGSTIYNHKSKHRECKDGSRYPTSVLKFNTERKKLHDTQKPIDLLEYLIKTYSNENSLILDNCMGSGSCGVACVNTNRNFIGIELDENYFNIAKKRIQGELK
jgi:site-specific DNA-methyltransferase (adenine-specific)